MTRAMHRHASGRPWVAFALVCAIALISLSLACGKYGKPQRVYEQGPAGNLQASGARAVEAEPAGDAASSPEESEERKDGAKR